MEFAKFCTVCENIRNTKGTVDKKIILQNFWESVRTNNYETYSILRLLVPKLDRDRASYRIKEAKISKLLIKMLSLPPGSDKNLLEKSVTSSSFDFGDIIHTVLKKYIVKKEIGMNIDDINNYLDKIATRTSDKGLDDLVLEIFRKLSPTNIKWIIQIILKDLKLGLGDNSLLNSFHKDAAGFYSTNNSLKQLCQVLHSSQVKLLELEITVFEIFRPMLSKRIDSSNFKKCFSDSKNYIIENKFDGERFQLHMENGNFQFFSRKGFDFTDSYGTSYDNGMFTEKLKKVFSPETKRVILDGEMMLWNKYTKSFGSKGMNADVKKLQEGKHQPCFCIFDILLHNDKVLANQPLIKRLQYLKTVVINPIVGTIVLSDFQEKRGYQEIIDALNLAVDYEQEGIVVKDPQSVYKCSDRNSGWYKLKTDYFDDIVNDLDVLLMGGSIIKGNRINSLMVGVSSNSNTYLSLGSISSGLNEDDLELLNNKLRTFGVDFNSFSTRTEGKLFFGKETPDIYIEPQNSCLLQIRASELCRATNDNVKCPYTLRFPRVLKIREDKPVSDCLSINELLELTGQNKAVIKLNKRHITFNDIAPKSKVKKLKVEILNMTDSYKGTFLKDRKFHVSSGSQKWPKEDVYFSIKNAGGTVKYQIDQTLDVIIAATLTSKLSEIMKKPNKIDIIHLDWLARVFEQKEVVDYKQEEIFYLGENNNRDLGKNFDQYCDSYTEEATRKSLEYSFQIMKQNSVPSKGNGIMDFRRTHSFLGYVAYFDAYEEINNTQSQLIYYAFPDQIEFEFCQGKISKTLTEEINLVIMKQADPKRKALLEGVIQKLGNKKVEIVSKEFLQEKI